jgi:hypothetical protein
MRPPPRLEIEPQRGVELCSRCVSHAPDGLGFRGLGRAAPQNPVKNDVDAMWHLVAAPGDVLIGVDEGNRCLPITGEIAISPNSMTVSGIRKYRCALPRGHR